MLPTYKGTYKVMKMDNISYLNEKLDDIYATLKQAIKR